MFTLSANSLQKLAGVHIDLQKVVRRAIEITDVDFTVVEGLRDIARQKQLVAEGKSKTMNSRHLSGHAVDLGPIVNKQIAWDKCGTVSKAMFQAAKELKTPLRWGGDFNQNGIVGDDSFYDGPHFELPSKSYP